MQLFDFIKKQTQLSEKSVQNTIKLLQEDCTIPFIARYRKEMTGNLDEVQIEEILKAKNYYEELVKRKTSILTSIEEQGALTADLKAKIKAAESLILLEDLYLPYKKKRKTKADQAREEGLEPLAKIIMAQNAHNLQQIAQNYRTDKVKDASEALGGARLIIAEWISERSDIRDYMRNQFHNFSIITSSVVKTKANNEKAQKFKDYFDWSESLKKIPSHRFLAIQRAETEGFIRVKLKADKERILQYMERKIIRSSGECAEQIELAIADSYQRLLKPSLENEAFLQAKKRADDSAIGVFAKNLKQLLLGAPLGEKRVLAIDPGFRTGCKLVCLDAQGDLLHNETIYPHPPQKDQKTAIKKISTLTEAYKIDAIAIGNGTASRETEALVRKIRFKNEIQVFVVSEAGASVYSASSVAREEFPNYDATVRGSVSIGRRLQDPLAELVKIDAKAIGVGQYQHDVDQAQLKLALDRVVESCVNAVGVNINTASKSLLSYVSGIGEKLAENILEYRTENGTFTHRNEIKKVKRLGNKAFVQSAGFLRIKNADHPLDDSAVHPERYALVEKIAKDEGRSISELIGSTDLLHKINLEKYVSGEVGLPTLKDIIAELEKPGLDIREKAKVFTFNQNIKTIDDLREGQLLPGIVNNITNFGCFVDVGIKESGLIHVSNLANEFVSDVNDYVHLHQQVIVKVLEVDVARKRIQLKLYRKR
ncbi:MULTISPECIES: Tex family protein [Mesonia]|uniref:30S ribosomal protein S1 n=1 Tax=Mesonia oceanica TaxID=2687242 RepID=A0AC61Y9Q7_9FLAO|nr:MULTISPECIES: Tex family protein [Mesonia]MAN27793.1 RNA-binding transcriptional accessory protein [Mesonia sp.]MAQ40973.1 RNA-binding transcriptional accessory protein [Mesonia sp.]MBJ96487.1 RNA-binding transcriptional accessory protein [Flavobacteriaceae bacterium]VVV01065.1 30S ribosomal protein S1 [Mesonia oceanica]